MLSIAVREVLTIKQASSVYIRDPYKLCITAPSAEGSRRQNADKACGARTPAPSAGTPHGTEQRNDDELTEISTNLI